MYCGLRLRYDNLVSSTAANEIVTLIVVRNYYVPNKIQGGALNRGLFLADPPPSLLGAVSGKISEIR
jgi:hypothetical protein